MRKTNKELEDFLFEEDRGVVRVFFVFITLNVDLLKKVRRNSQEWERFQGRNTSLVFFLN